MSNQPILIPARTDINSWKTLLNKCPKWLLSMHFAKTITRASNRHIDLNTFTHPACVKACETVIQYSKQHPYEKTVQPNINHQESNPKERM